MADDPQFARWQRNQYLSADLIRDVDPEHLRGILLGFVESSEEEARRMGDPDPRVMVLFATSWFAPGFYPEP